MWYRTCCATASSTDGHRSLCVRQTTALLHRLLYKLLHRLLHRLLLRLTSQNEHCFFPQVLQALQNAAADSLEGCILECPAGLQALVEVLRDPREEVRNEVVVFLGHVSSKPFLLPVLPYLLSLDFLSACTFQVVASLLASRENLKLEFRVLRVT